MTELDTLRLLMRAEYDRTDPKAAEALMMMIGQRIGRVQTGSAEYVAVHAKLDELLTAREAALRALDVSS